MTTPFDTYIAKIEADLHGGKAAEHDHYSPCERVAIALKETLHVMQEIDKAIGHWPMS